MAKIKVNITGKAFTGKVVTFTAPCGCDQVTDGLVINGETYTVCDAMGECVTGKGGAWCAGAQISVVLDCENKKAFIQNGKATPAAMGAVAQFHVTQEMLDNPAYPTAYIGSCFGLSGLPGAEHWRIIYIPYHDYLEGYGIQIAVEAITGEKMYVRKAMGTTWNNWVQFATTDYALNKAGDTMDGNLGIASGYGFIEANERYVELNAYSAPYMDAGQGMRELTLYNHAATGDIKNAFRLFDTKPGGEVATYDILHTGNSNKTSLVSTDTTPVENNHINWTYE